MIATINPTGDAQVDALAAELHQQRYDAEVDLIAAILSPDVLRGVDKADALGVNQLTFDADDLGLAYLAAQIAGKHGLPVTLRLWLGAVRHYGFFAADIPHFGRGPEWSEKSIGSIANSYPSSAAVESRVHRLLDLRRRQDEAAAHLQRMMAALRGDSTPTPKIQPVRREEKLLRADDAKWVTSKGPETPYRNPLYAGFSGNPELPERGTLREREKSSAWRGQ